MVVMIVPQLRLTGGAERQALRLSASLEAHGQRVTILTSDFGRVSDGRHSPRVVSIPRPFYVRGLRKISTMLFCLVAAAWIIRNRREIQVVHAHILSPQAISASIAARLCRIPAVVKVSSSGLNADYGRYLEHPLRRMLVEWAVTRIVATSSLAASELEELGMSPSQICRIPNGVPVRSEIQRRSPQQTVRFICVASFRAIKGHEVLLQAWARMLRMTAKNCSLVLIGEGQLGDTIVALIEQLQISDTVELRGNVSNVAAELQESDVFVLSSWAEGMSNALLEAMESGLPCVVTDVGANRENVGAEGEPLLVSAGDDKGLALRLLKVAEDHELRARVGIAMRERILRCYSIERVAARYQDLYRVLSATSRSH